MLRLQQGDTFAGCRILTMCGSGGMGVVYLAEDTLGRVIALKIVSIVDSERELRGIRKYIQIAQGCPNLIQIYHAGIEKDYLFYIMEAADPLEDTGDSYVPKTLSAVLNKTRKLSPEESLSIIHSLASGLQVLHNSDLIHRDIKPENIVYVNGIPKLCDPGLVCEMEATASFVGTLGYLPHECFNGLNLNSVGRDIYALGKVFYVSVTGESAARYPHLPMDLPLNVRRQLWPILTRVCENDQKHRFHSVAEFCEALPKGIAKPTKWESMQERFLQWRLTHPGTMALLIFLGVFLTIASVTGSVYYIRQQDKAAALRLEQQQKEAALRLEQEKRESALRLEQQKKELALALEEKERQAARQREFQKKCDILEKSLRKNETIFYEQLSSLESPAEANRMKKVLETLPEDSEKRFVILQQLEKDIRTIALRHVPEIPAIASFENAFKVSSSVRGLFASPLGAWISPEKKKETLKKLKVLESLIFLPGIALKPGVDYVPAPSFWFKFVYIPAGSFRNKKGKLIKIPNAFWCCDGEIRTDRFCSVLNQTQTSVIPDMPMTKFCWNDLLSFCKKKTIASQKNGAIPEGFIYRPMTTDEWEWVCRGAWSGPGSPTMLLKKNSGKNASPVLTGLPNSLGIYNMIGNVAEITMPMTPDVSSVRISGGWYQQRKVDPEKHGHYLKYQFLPPYVGSRIVIAPGTLDFFDKQLWVSGKRQTVYNGWLYELLATNETSITLPEARKICSLLGGKLLEPETKDLLKHLQKSFYETNSFPTMVNGNFVNGQWVRPNGRTFGNVPMPKSPEFPEWCLVFQGGRIKCFRGKSSAGVICQWTKEEYQKRTDLERILKNPAIVHSFEVDDKVYLLVGYRSHVHILRRIAELLGGRLAEPRTPELRARFQKELARWKKCGVIMGGVWMHDHWRLSDGSALDLKLSLKGVTYRSSLHSAAPGLFNGEFCALQKAHMFLLEFSSVRKRSTASGISTMH